MCGVFLYVVPKQRETNVKIPYRLIDNLKENTKLCKYSSISLSISHVLNIYALAIHRTEDASNVIW